MQSANQHFSVSNNATTQGRVQPANQPARDHDDQSTPPVSHNGRSPLTDHADEDVAELMTVVLDASLLRRQSKALAATGFTQTDRDCPSCDPGVLWSHNHETVCDCCSIVFDEEARRRQRPERQSPWEHFQASHDQYRNGRVRLPGGYPHVYSWVDDDIPDPNVIDVDVSPREFYQ